VMGRSGRAMIQALIDGESDPAKLAALAHWKVRASAETLREALHGRIKRHHRFLLRLHLQHSSNQLKTFSMGGVMSASVGSPGPLSGGLIRQTIMKSEIERRHPARNERRCSASAVVQPVDGRRHRTSVDASSARAKMMLL
jgi:hypothetical protein